MCENLTILRQELYENFPGGPVVKNLPANTGDLGFDSLSRKIPHALGQLSPCVATTEAQAPIACALQQEKPPQWEVHASNKEWPSLATTRKSPQAATKTQHNQNKRRTVWDISASPSSSLPKYSSMQDSKWIAYLYSGIYRWVAFNIKLIMCYLSYCFITMLSKNYITIPYASLPG